MIIRLSKRHGLSRMSAMKLPGRWGIYDRFYYLKLSFNKLINKAGKKVIMKNYFYKEKIKLSFKY
jgi:hypothetical protein